MDQTLRYQVLRALATDPTFLKSGHFQVDPEMFQEEEERIVAQVALDFYSSNQEPIGMLLANDAEDQAAKQRFDPAQKQKLKDLLRVLQNGKMQLVSVKALLERVERLKKKAFYSRAMDSLVSAYEEGTLTQATLEELVDKARTELHVNGFVIKNYFDDKEVSNRIARRSHSDDRHKYPVCGIHPLDSQIKLIARGQFGFLLAPAASGKGLALVKFGMAYAMQGFKVLHFTLEDPVDLVEDRMDAAWAGIPMRLLAARPRSLRKAFDDSRATYKGRVKIIDGTDGDWTVSKIEKIWDQERLKGFNADAIIIDYDDELKPETKYKGDRVRMQEFNEIYRNLRRMAAKLNIFLWTAAQATRISEEKKTITGRDVAEDYGKVRKAFVAISIGRDKDDENTRHLYVLRHRLDKSKFSVKIKTDFNNGLFYDADATRAMEIEDTKKKQRRLP